MDLHIEWARPISVEKAKNGVLAYGIDLEAVPDEPGVYIFGRRWGVSYEALYVGKAGNLRRRVRSHLNNARLLRHLEESRNGKKVLLAGRIRTKPGQRIQKCLTIAERAIMRHFLLEGHDLVNKQGTRIRRHSIRSGNQPKRFFPAEIQIEKRRGE